MLTAAGIVFLAAAGCSSGPTTASRFGSPSAATSVTLRGPSGQGIQSVAFSPDGNTIATIANSDSSGKIYLWDASRRTLTATLTDPAGQAFLSVAFSPDGKTIATGDGGLGPGHFGNTYLWDASRHTLTATLTEPASQGAWAVVFSPDGKTIATSGDDGKIHLWNASRHALIATLAAPLADPSGVAANSVAFSPDGKTIAAGDNNGETYLWDASRHTLTATLADPLGLIITSVAFSPDGKTIATGDGTGVVAGGTGKGNTYLWDASRHTRIATLASPPGVNVQWVAFSPDGTVIATGDNNGQNWEGTGKGSTYLWDASRHTMIATLADPSGQGIESVAFSPDGSTIATADANGSAYLWRPGSSG